MKLIVGLGNPGAKYENSRHNLGFMVIDGFVRSRGLYWRKSSDWICYYVREPEFVLVKPSTFMNKSGISILAVSNFFRIDRKDVLVIHDDLDLDFGKIRLVFDSSSAGHRGVESIVESLGSIDFGRLRVGIGRPSPAKPDSDGKSPDMESYVLMDFTDEEKKELLGVIGKSVEAVDAYLKEGLMAAMNKFN